MILKYYIASFVFVVQIAFSTAVSAGTNGILSGSGEIPEKVCHVISSHSTLHQAEETAAETEEEEEPDCE